MTHKNERPIKLFYNEGKQTWKLSISLDVNTNIHEY